MKEPIVHPHEKWKGVKTGVYCWIFFVIGLIQGVIGPVLSVLQQHVGTTEALIGTLVVARGIGWLIGSVCAGFLFARFNAHMLLMISCIVLVITHLAVPFIPLFSALWMTFLIIGIAGGISETGGNTVLLWLWRDSVQRYLQLLNFAIGIGAFCSPMLMAAFLTRESPAFSVIASFWTLSVLFLPVLSLSALTAPSPPQENSTTSEESKGDDVPLDDDSSKELRPRANHWPLVITVSAFALFVSGIEVSTGALMALFASRLFPSWTPQQCDLTTSLFYATFTLSRLALALPPPRFAPPAVFLPILLALLSAASALLYAAAKTVLPNLFLGSIALLGAALGPLFAVALAYPIQSPAAYLLSARDVAIVVSTSNAGELLTPLLISACWTWLGPFAYVYTTTSLTALSCIGGVLLYIVCRKR